MQKSCTKCKVKYPSGLHFYRDVQKWDGLTSQCKRCLRSKKIAYYTHNREKLLAYARKHYRANSEARRLRAKQRRQTKVATIFDRLGNQCTICGFSNKVALQIDHISGGGYQHRKQSGGGETYYTDILKNLDAYRLLCANCNSIEGVKKNHRTSIWN